MFVLGRFDCMLPCKKIHCRSNSSVTKHHRFRSSSQIQYSLGTLHKTAIRVLWQPDKPDARFQHFLINECCSPYCSATFHMLNELALIPFFSVLAFHPHENGDFGPQNTEVFWKLSPEWKFLKTPGCRFREDGPKRTFRIWWCHISYCATSVKLANV